MNIQKALDLADSMKPNMMAKPVKIAFLQELDQLIYKEILLKHQSLMNLQKNLIWTQSNFVR